MIRFTHILPLFFVIGLVACQLNSTNTPPTSSILEATPSLQYLASPSVGIQVSPSPFLVTSPIPTITTPPSSISPEPVNATATLLPLPTLPPPMPGWTWYQNQEFGFRIAYPQVWKVVNGSRDGQFIFSSPETNSEVRINIWDAPAQTEPNAWLSWVKANQGRLVLNLSPEFIDTNATILGQPAFFHFTPSLGGGGDMATLVFANADYVFNLSFHSGTLPSLKPEGAIYHQMIRSFFRFEGLNPQTDVPTDWIQGEFLTIIPDMLEQDVSSNEELELYQAGLVGTITGFDPGELTLVDESGQSHVVRTGGYYFMGIRQDLQGVEGFTEVVGEGSRILVVGYPLASGGLRPQYLAVEKEGEWLPYAYQSFFDLTREELDPTLLALYPQNEIVKLWLRGASQKVLSYLIDDIDNPFTSHDISTNSTQEILVYGTLQMPSNPHLEVEELYVLEGDCITPNEFEQDCFPWIKLYPPSSEMVITATVGTIVSETATIILKQPSQGFIMVKLVPEGQVLMVDGQQVTWEEIMEGQQIIATGEMETGGVLLAQKIYISVIQE